MVSTTLQTRHTSSSLWPAGGSAHYINACIDFVNNTAAYHVLLLHTLHHKELEYEQHIAELSRYFLDLAIQKACCRTQVNKN